MKTMRILSFVVAFLILSFSNASSQSSPANAFENVIIHTADGTVIENGTIVWRNGVLEAVGTEVRVPFDAYTIDGGDSLHVYPGFIDGLALWGSPDLPEEFKRPERPGDPGYERAGIQPQRYPGNFLNEKDKDFETAQKHGFTMAGLALKGFMLPGQVDLYFINGENTGEHLFKPGHALHMQFEDAPRRVYPSTQMGIMAAFRQLWYDATALQEQINYFANSSGNYPAPDRNIVQESLFPVMNGEKPVYFVADEFGQIEKALKLSKELGFGFTLVSGKEAYQLAGDLAKRNITVLAGIDLPDAPEWHDKENEQEEELTDEQKQFRERQLEAYEEQVSGIKKLMDAGVKVGFSSNGLKITDMPGKIRTLIEEGGMDESMLLQLFTRNTAEILGVSDRLGDLKQGYFASFSVFTKPFSEEKAQVKYSVSNGELSEFKVSSDSNKSEKDEKK